MNEYLILTPKAIAFGGFCKAKDFKKSINKFKETIE